MCKSSTHAPPGANTLITRATALAHANKHKHPAAAQAQQSWRHARPKHTCHYSMYDIACCVEHTACLHISCTMYATPYLICHRSYIIGPSFYTISHGDKPQETLLVGRTRSGTCSHIEAHAVKLALSSPAWLECFPPSAWAFCLASACFVHHRS